MSDISSISSSSASSLFSSSGSGSSGIDQLEKQKADLQKQISDEQSSKDDAKTQALKITQLQQEVAAVDAEIQAEKAKEAKAEKSDQSAKGAGFSSKQPNPDPTKLLDESI